MAEEYEQLKLNNQLCFPLYVASKEVIRQYKPILDELDLTYTSYITLLALWEHKMLTVTKLGELLWLDSGTLTPLLKKMEANGLVMRKRNEQDERIVTVTLTEQGEALKQKAKNIPLKIAQCVNLDEKEAAQLYGLLHKVMGK